MTDTVDTSAQSGNESGGEATQYGGFATVEELVAAYEATKAPAGEPATNEALTVTKAEGGDEGGEGDGEGGEGEGEVADALKAAGLNQDDFTKEFADTGDLSTESFDKLEKAGFPRAMVETYVRGLKADRDAFQTSIYSEAGGVDSYKSLIQWAGKALDQAEIDAFNKAVTSGDPASARLAVRGLAAKHKSTARPALLNGKGGTGGDGVKPFESVAQRRAAYNDPRYRTDPAYRAEVSARVAVSDL